jgi:hypothetical protein
VCVAFCLPASLSVRAAKEPEHKDRRREEKKTQNAFFGRQMKRELERKDERMKNHLIFNP